MRFILKVGVLLSLLALVAHAGFAVGSFHGSVVEPWREAVNAEEPTRLYEASREAWFAAKRIKLEVSEREFFRAIEDFYGQAIRIAADFDAHEASRQESLRAQHALQDRYRTTPIPVGLRWYVSTRWKWLVFMAFVAGGCLFGLVIGVRRPRTRWSF